MAKAWRRTYKSATGTRAREGIKKVMKSQGVSRSEARKAVKKSAKAIRRGRISQGVNPNTGKTYSSKQLGLKGGTKKKYASGSKSYKQAIVRAGSKRTKSGNIRSTKGRGPATGKRGIKRGVKGLYRSGKKK